MALSNKSEIERVIHARGKIVSKEFYAWYEAQCERLLDIAIQASALNKLVGVKSTLALLRAIGKGL